MRWITSDPLMMCLWAFSIASEITLVAVVLRSSTFRFPCFRLMAAFDLAKSLALVLCTAAGARAIYGHIYWWGLAAQAGITLAALLEAASCTLRPYETLPPRFLKSSTVGLSLVTLVALLAFLRGPHSYHDWLTITGRVADRSVSIFGTGATVLLLALTRRSGLPWRPQAYRIVIGMALMFSFDQAITAIVVPTGNSRLAVFSYLRMLIFSTVQAIWISAVRLPDTARIHPTTKTIAAMRRAMMSIYQQVKDQQLEVTQLKGL